MKQMNHNPRGECNNCKKEVEGDEIAWNNPYADKAPWPVFYDGIWCKPCADNIDIPDEPRLNGSSVFILGPKGL